MKQILSKVIICTVALAATPCRGDSADGLRAPDSPLASRGETHTFPVTRDKAPAVAEPARTSGLGRTFARIWLTAYRGILSRFIRSRCPMHPSCSTYSLEAVRQHGALMGTILTADRLLREADDVPTAPRLWIEGRGIRCEDTVTQNTLWWRPGAGR
jgi:hypothetical protein